MKVVNVFAQIFAIFAFLTLGSFFLIVAFHVLSLEDALFKVREVYQNPTQSFHLGFLGFVFIVFGIIFSRKLVKKGRGQDAIIYQGESGPMVVSVNAIEDILRKVLKKFHLVKDWRAKTIIQGKDLEIRLRLVLWAGGGVPVLLAAIQDEISERLKKMLGTDNRFEILCDVQRIEDHEAEPQGQELNKVGV
ncbi:MAG: alkaline shock response membrane anchor protein AmaP [Candidatus Omnitrophica bacterium]|nr:alkaline shock response membrane anchor protein AmaP [Candidatus Omnitrophota bacterium]